MAVDRRKGAFRTAMATHIRSQFSEFYGGAECSFVVRAPGRVNLIGEHTDYNGFPVLPMSLDRAICAAVRPRGDRTVALHNVDPAYRARSFELATQIPPYPSGDWGNYIKAGIQGVIDWPERSKPVSELRGCDLLISGDIPPGAGLSSSSAMVVASALAFLEANEMPYDRIRLAEMLAAAEHYVGTQGGGMDQAICLLGKVGEAIKIDFFPLRTLSVPMPDGCSIVICNSLIRAEKTRAALWLYNRRPIECRIAVAMLVKEAGEPRGSIPRLAGLCGSQMDIRRLLDHTQAFFHEAGYGWDEVAAFLEETPEETAARLGEMSGAQQCNYWASGGIEETAARLGEMSDGSSFGEPEDGFLLRKRVRHVLTEARRVEESVRCLSSGDAATFGALMNDSHRSCRDDYEISCPELDVLVQTARAAGALGSRLTGAGFGGCTVSLVRDDLVDGFSIRVWEEYYERYLAQRRPDLTERIDLDDVLFVCKPARGAEVLRWE